MLNLKYHGYGILLLCGQPLFLTIPFQAYIEAGGQLSKSQALAIASTNIEKLLGIAPETALLNDLVVTHGGDLFDMESKVIGVVSPLRNQVELL